MKVTIGSIVKKINSTSSEFNKRFENVEFTLKEATSITEPVLLLKCMNLNTASLVNYCYIEGWGYYWIDDIIYSTYDLREVHCHRDVLATFKDLIKSCEAYIKYTSSIGTFTNFELDDPRLTPEVEYSFSESFPVSTFGGKPFDADGCVVMKVIAMVKTSSGSNGSGIITYILPDYVFTDFIRAFADEFVDNFKDAVKYLLGNSNFKENIVSARWYPLKYDSMPGTATTAINLGGFNATVSKAKVLNTPYYILPSSGTVNLNFNLPSSTYKFLRGKKYTSIQFVHPGGIVDLSSDDFINLGTIFLRLCFEITSGEYAFMIVPYGSSSTPGGNQYMLATGQFGIDVMNTGTTKENPYVSVGIGAASMIAHAVPVALGGGSFDMGENLQKYFTGISGTFEAHNHNGGANSGVQPSSLSTFYANTYNSTNLDQAFKIQITTYVPHIMKQGQNGVNFYADYAKKYGYAFNGVLPLSVLDDGSYVECVGAQIGQSWPPTVIVAKVPTATEIQAINTYLNSGIYLE